MPKTHLVVCILVGFWILVSQSSKTSTSSVQFELSRNGHTALPVFVSLAFDTVNVSEAVSPLDDVQTEYRDARNNTDDMETVITSVHVIMRDIMTWLRTLQSLSEAVHTSGFAGWSQWGLCSYETYVQTRFRTCLFGRIGSFLCSGPTNISRPCCPRDFYDLRKFGFRNCIKYHHHSTTHDDAQETCIKMNGHLIEVASAEKKAVIKQYTKQIPNLITYQYFHIDGELSNGTWVTRYGVPLSYIPWGDEPYLKPGWIYLGLHPDDFLVYDIYLDYKRQFVCEVDI